MANAKGGGGRHVSASLMVEWPDHVDILVARNSGFKHGDPGLGMLETLSSSLPEIARLGILGPSSAPAQKIWASLVEWYRPRLVDYIIQAKLALKKVNRDDARARQVLSPLMARFRELYMTLDNAARSSSHAELRDTAVLAHDLLRDYREVEFREVVGHNANAQSLRSALGFLGRVQTCFNTFIRAAEKLDNFSALRIVPVTIQASNLQNGTAQTKWSAVETFASLNLRLDDDTAETVMGSWNPKAKAAWTKGKLLQRFGKLKSPASEVHAEVQVVLGLAKHQPVGAAVFDYIGCSKRSCFLCAEFLKSYGSFTTRGCHGKLYSLWGGGAPSPDSLRRLNGRTDSRRYHLCRKGHEKAPLEQDEEQRNPPCG